MPEIMVEQSTFERLKRHAEPLVDTADKVVSRALDALEQNGFPVAPGGGPPISERWIDPNDLPNLTHTKVLDASLEGESLVKPNWNQILERILVRAMKRLGDFGDLRQYCPVNMVQGRKEDEGYRYLSEIDISVQGQPANEACRALVYSAQRLGIELEMTFEWRSREGAAYPGERARLSLAAKSDGGKRVPKLDDL